MKDTQTFEFHSPQTLMAAGNQLPTADEREIYWNDPAEDTGGFDFKDEVPGHKAVYNEETGQLFGVVSNDYTVINCPQFLGPLVAEINERGRDDVRGQFNVYDGGAFGYGEMLFDTDAVWPPDRNRSDDPVRVGISLRWSHDGGISVRASGFAQDGICKNTMRQVTDAVYVKHAGDVGNRVDWNAEWSAVLSQLGTFSETLALVIEEALEFEMFDFGEESFDSDWVNVTDPQEAIEDVPAPTGVTDREIRGLHGFYDYLGFPNYLALAATDRLAFRMSRRDDPRTATAWDVYSALTYALTHEGRFEAGSSSDDKYHRYASDLLSNPMKALEDANRELASRLDTDTEQEVFGLESTVGEALSVYEEREQQLRASFDGDD